MVICLLDNTPIGGTKDPRKIFNEHPLTNLSRTRLGTFFSSFFSSFFFFFFFFSPTHFTKLYKHFPQVPAGWNAAGGWRGGGEGEGGGQEQVPQPEGRSLGGGAPRQHHWGAGARATGLHQVGHLYIPSYLGFFIFYASICNCWLLGDKLWICAASHIFCSKSVVIYSHSLWGVKV